MIPPRKLEYYAKKNEEKNYRFRTFLKIYADEKELDEQFLKLHEELFSEYDCSRCRNCCKAYHAEILPEEVENISRSLQMNPKEFIRLYLDWSDENRQYLTKHKPCDFFQSDGNCMLGDCKPNSCVKYPYTNESGRIHSLYSIIDITSVCPVAYEIWERLKAYYHFH